MASIFHKVDRWSSTFKPLETRKRTTQVQRNRVETTLFFRDKKKVVSWSDKFMGWAGLGNTRILFDVELFEMSHHSPFLAELAHPDNRDALRLVPKFAPLEELDEVKAAVSNIIAGRQVEPAMIRRVHRLLFFVKMSQRPNDYGEGHIAKRSRLQALISMSNEVIMTNPEGGDSSKDTYSFGVLMKELMTKQ